MKVKCIKSIKENYHGTNKPFEFFTKGKIYYTISEPKIDLYVEGNECEVYIVGVKCKGNIEDPFFKEHFEVVAV